MLALMLIRKQFFKKNYQIIVFVLDMDELLILNKFPLIIPQNEMLTAYKGDISVCNREFSISLKVPNYPSLQGSTIILPWDLNAILINNNQEVEKWLSSCTSLLSFLENLHSKIMLCLESRFAKLLLYSGERMNIDCYSRLITDIKEIGLAHVSFITNDLSTFEVVAYDNCNNQHTLLIKHILGQLNSSPQFEADLPLQALKKLDEQKDCSLTELFKTFKKVVQQLSNFWNIMKDIDSKCWVIDPAVCKQSHTHRRIVLSRHVTLLLTFDPFKANIPPEFNFFGPANIVDHFNKLLYTNINLWSSSDSFCENLLAVLNIDSFPIDSETSTQNGDEVIECNICYSHMLNGQNPTVSCLNNLCGAVYHTVCLYEWLLALSKIVMCTTIHSNCPNCDAKIVFKMKTSGDS